MLPKNDFDVVCAKKSAQHQIRLSEDKPFQERAWQIRLRDLEDLWGQLA